MKKANFIQRFVAVLIDGVLFAAIGLVSRNSYFGLASILYETILISQWNGYTVGKKAMGIRVVGASGGKVDILHAFIRSIGKILSGVVFLLGYLWMLWDGNSQTWHDKLAETYVVEG